MNEHWTLLNSVDGTCLYTVGSEEEALKWCHSDYGGDNVIRPLRVYMAHDVVAAEQAAYERGIRRAAAICYEIGEKVMHPTQTITRRCEQAILAEIGEKP